MTYRKPRLVETLVSWIHPQVMVFLGKVMNPITQKAERDLPSARALIDLLAELEVKTEGHLDEEEQRLLKTALTELRLNYLDEMNRPEPEAKAEETPESGAAGGDEEEAGTSESTAGDAAQT